jgi:hypothetical protein
MGAGRGRNWEGWKSLVVWLWGKYRLSVSVRNVPVSDDGIDELDCKDWD